MRTGRIHARFGVPYNRRLELKIEKLIYGGEGLAHLPADERGKGKAAFVPFVIPGERVDATTVEEKAGFARARLDQVLEASPRRIQPGCPYFYQCGGCQYQHIEYDDQLRYKTEILRETLRRIAKVDVDDIVPHPSPPWNYRNRARMRAQTKPEFAIGYNRFGSDELLPVRECPISSPLINHVLSAVWRQGEAGNVPSGTLEMEFFANADDSELLLEVILDAKQGKRNLPALAEFARALRAEAPAVIGVPGIAKRPGADTKRLGTTGEAIRGLGCTAVAYRTAAANYHVSAGSFFQTNRYLIDEMVALTTAGRRGASALDLYAGTGLFTLPLAENFRRVTAVEAAPLSFADLERNAPGNIAARQTMVEDFLSGSARDGKYDYVVLDPPRGGLGEKAAHALAELKAPEITYASCDPATLARDVRVLLGAGYVVRGAHLLDMFPQTFHIESIVHLSQGF